MILGGTTSGGLPSPSRRVYSRAEMIDAVMQAETWTRLLARDPETIAGSALYGPVLAPPRPGRACFVIGRIAQSLDGCIATMVGESRWISGPADILHTHRLRALCDAIVVGAATVLADDPRLTTRACPGPSPLRVVIDPDCRLSSRHRVFSEAPGALVVCADDGPAARTHDPARTVAVSRAADGSLDVHAILAALATRGLRRVFVEGGGRTVSRFVAAGALDRLHVTVAPLLMGGGIPAFTLPSAGTIADAARLRWTPHRLGADMLFDIAFETGATVQKARSP